MHMKPDTFIFIGRSGCGKGTQADQLQVHLTTHFSPDSFFRLETGKKFREFIEGTSYVSRLAKKTYDEGGLMPEFLSVWAWSDSFIGNLKEHQHIILDGSPRRLVEAHAFETAFDYFGRFSDGSKVNVIFLNVGNDEATRRLLERKRLDDNTEDIKARMAWYESEVLKVVEWYRANPRYHFIEINGEHAREKVQQDILTATGHDKY